MSTDPTQPMSQPASAGADWPEQPESQQREVPDATRAEPSAQPSFQPAQPSFTPAQPGAQPPAPPGPPTPSTPQQPGAEQGQALHPDSRPQQPPQYGPQPGWPDRGGASTPPGGTPQWQAPGPDGYPGAPGAPGTPGAPGGPRPRRRRRRRRWTMVVFGVIVVLILLVIGDRVALAVAENDMADQFVSNGLPVKPSVTIEGFPFLTQLAARDLRKVDISASNIPAGPVTITSATGTLNGLHFNSSFNSATVDHMTVTIFVSFAALAGAGGLGNVANLTVTPAGPNLLKITGSLGGVLSDTEEAKITQSGPQQISVQAVNNGGALSGVLSQFGSYTFNLPKGVPASLRITGLTLNAQGLTATATADNAKLSQPSA
jgi:LmeA-like phospholipid-binding